jgi:hypothetical protein
MVSISSRWPGFQPSSRSRNRSCTPAGPIDPGRRHHQPARHDTPEPGQRGQRRQRRSNDIVAGFESISSNGRSPDAVAMQGRPQHLKLLYLGANPHGALELLNAFAYMWELSRGQIAGWLISSG